MNFRQMILGKPLSSHALEDETLPKIIALPIFASDALSSVAYATQEMMLALVVAGSAAFHVSFAEALAIFFLLVILTASYNQTIFAYPQGGGAYNVAQDNLGVTAAQVAAVSLMTDYILTVAVSVASGIDAILSAVPELNILWVRLLLCLLSIWFIVWMNLRGVRESGRAFALPVYIFVFSILTLVAIGLWQLHLGEFGRLHPTLHQVFIPHAGVTLGVLLILHSFAQGCTALTGLEAISNSTGAFRTPKSHNAAVTMRWLAVFLGSMLLGITWLAQKLASTHQLIPSDSGETVISQIAHATIGHTWFYWVVQISTFAILILAANTSFSGFPRLSAMAAADGYLPRQLMTLGDRLVYNNGIILLGIVASALVVAFKGSTDKLIPLYAVGVYTAFTLSQAGMVVRWKRLRTSGWQTKAVMNGIGSFITAVVAVMFGAVKFKEGAWIVLILIPSLTFLLHRIGLHYRHVSSQLTPDEHKPLIDPRPHVALVPAHRLSDDVRGAIDYARIIRPDEIELLQWTSPGEQPENIEVAGATTVRDNTSTGWREAILNQIRSIHKEKNALVTIVLSEDMPFVGWARLLRHQPELVIKLALLNERGVVVADTRRYRNAPGLADSVDVRRAPPHTALVLVPRVHRGVMEALSYARRISRDVQTLHIEIDPKDTTQLRQDWERLVPDIPLMVMESPYRQVRTPLIRYIEALRTHKPGCIITVIVPEFVAEKWWNKILHNHAGLLLKIALRQISGIVLANPRYFLEDAPAPAASDNGRRETIPH